MRPSRRRSSWAVLAGAVAAGALSCVTLLTPSITAAGAAAAGAKAGAAVGVACRLDSRLLSRLESFSCRLPCCSSDCRSWLKRLSAEDALLITSAAASCPCPPAAWLAGSAGAVVGAQPWLAACCSSIGPWAAAGPLGGSPPGSCGIGCCALALCLCAETRTAGSEGSRMAPSSSSSATTCLHAVIASLVGLAGSLSVAGGGLLLITGMEGPEESSP